MYRTDLRYWYIKVQVEAQYGSREQYHEDRKSSVFEIRHLHFHATEFDAPADK